MKAEILMIGTELLLGQIEDTNATFMSRTLAESGIHLYQKGTVGDNRPRVVQALRDALTRSDVVLCSGGLGPTEDDLTRECVAEVFDCGLEYHEEIFDHIESLFARYKLKLTENNKRQAMVPEGGIVIDNPNGTAPGLIVEGPQGVVICMPGVPRELKPMLTNSVIPYLREKFDLGELIHYRVLKVCGLGESHVDQAIGDLITDGTNPTVGVLANPNAVRIRIAAQASSVEAANRLIDPVAEEVHRRLPGLVMGTNDDTIEGVVNNLLAERGWTLGVVETSSGGMLSQRLVAGNATQFAGAKVHAVNGPIQGGPEKAARDWAAELREELSADTALAIVSDAEAGLTAVTFTHPNGTEEWAFGRPGTSEIMQARQATVALEYVRRYLVNPA